jgi:hypothetical protein
VSFLDNLFHLFYEYLQSSLVDIMEDSDNAAVHLAAANGDIDRIMAVVEDVMSTDAHSTMNAFAKISMAAPIIAAIFAIVPGLPTVTYVAIAMAGPMYLAQYMEMDVMGK